jgi:protein O-GlcNAc transferase
MNIQKLKQQAYTFLQGNRLPDAKALCQQVCNIAKHDAEAWGLLGVIHGMLGENQEGESCCRKAIALQPASAGIHNNLGNLLRLMGRPDEAEQCYRDAMRYAPGSADAYCNLGVLLREKQRSDEALASFRQALAINPNYAEAYNNMSLVFGDLGMPQKAMDACRASIKIKPDYADAYNNLGYLLFETGAIDAAIDNYRHALRLNPASMRARTNLVFSLNYHPTMESGEIAEEHKLIGQYYAAMTRADSMPYENSVDDYRRIRVGYVSPDFREHSVCHFIEPLLACHDKGIVDTVLYADVDKEDDKTRQLRLLASEWRDIHGLSDEEVVSRVRADRIDILVDLAGHTVGNRLQVFANKPAPVQVTYLGYPNTTGLPTMDYRLTDAQADPLGATDRFCSERLVRLPHGFLCYKPEEDAPQVAALPALSNGYITFGSFNNIVKVNEHVIALWASVLSRISGSRLILKSCFMESANVQERYYSLFSRYGVARERVDLVGERMSKNAHLSFYGRVDIALDPFPYNGTTTTCEALWMGVPVITLAGRTHAGRVGVSLLSRVGLEKYIAGNGAEYLDIAESLATDLAYLGKLRGMLRETVAASALCDGSGFARDVEAAYRSMWTAWCERNRE